MGSGVVNDNDLCLCGHVLGVHSVGGHKCWAWIQPANDVCKCEVFAKSGFLSSPQDTVTARDLVALVLALKPPEYEYRMTRAPKWTAPDSVETHFDYYATSGWESVSMSSDPEDKFVRFIWKRRKNGSETGK